MRKEVGPLYEWIDVGDRSVCSDCKKRASWTPKPLKEWKILGTPRKAGTQCGKNCRCCLMPTDISPDEIQEKTEELIERSVERAVSGIKVDLERGGSVLLNEFEKYEGLLTLPYSRISYMEELITKWKFRDGITDTPPALPREFFKLANIEKMIKWLEKELR